MYWVSSFPPPPPPQNVQEVQDCTNFLDQLHFSSKLLQKRQLITKIIKICKHKMTWTFFNSFLIPLMYTASKLNFQAS